MQMSVRLYVTTVCLAALVAATGVVAVGYPEPVGHLKAAVCFAGLGILANLLAHRLPFSAGGSIAFLPFLAAVLVAPSWVSVLTVALAMAGVEIANRRSFIKASFNVAQVTLALSVCLITYVGLGGSPIRSRADFSVDSTLYFAASFALFLTVNSLAVSGVIGVSQGRRLFEVWRSNTRLSLVFDFLSFPFVYVFAVAYVEYGVAGVAVLALQLLGVRQLYKTNWTLEKTNQDLLQLMVAAIEARDPYTSGHSRRVSEYSRIIARAVGVPSRQIERIAIAALLHDVGKIHENFAPILRKPSRLTDEEMAIMKTHPIKSAELVSNVSQLRDIISAVRHHHENWDGSGYPDGIAGAEIPLASRIIMFADTIDAMTTDRPYRAGMGEAQVRAELARMRGRQFDPDMCDLLLSSPHFKSIFKSSMDRQLTPAVHEAAVQLPVAVNM